MKPAGGYLGMHKSYERMKLFTTWPGMKQEMENYIKKCEICQKNKITQHRVKMPLQITTTPEVVWEKCCMDIVGPLTVTTGHKYVLTFQDELSKYTIAVPILQQDAETIARVLLKKLYSILVLCKLSLQNKAQIFLLNYLQICASF